MKIPGETGYEEAIIEMLEVGLSLYTHQIQALRDLHELIGCNAHNEGLYCCMDFLLGDFEVEED